MNAKKAGTEMQTDVRSRIINNIESNRSMIETSAFTVTDSLNNLINRVKTQPPMTAATTEEILKTGIIADDKQLVELLLDDLPEDAYAFDGDLFETLACKTLHRNHGTNFYRSLYELVRKRGREEALVSALSQHTRVKRNYVNQYVLETLYDHEKIYVATVLLSEWIGMRDKANADVIENTLDRLDGLLDEDEQVKIVKAIFSHSLCQEIKDLLPHSALTRATLRLAVKHIGCIGTVSPAKYASKIKYYRSLRPFDAASPEDKDAVLPEIDLLGPAHRIAQRDDRKTLRWYIQNIKGYIDDKFVEDLYSFLINDEHNTATVALRTLIDQGIEPPEQYMESVYVALKQAELLTDHERARMTAQEV